jgi:exopolyphosphatase/guanosine-5'-triphosphate,3'-diphosphate pyrophosphatase
MENCCFAAVDMGTNSFHMIIARLKSDGSIKIIDREKQVIRLSSHKGKDLSFISDEETELAIEVLRKFKKLAEYYGAKFRAVATSAVREAKNKSEFIRKVKQTAGITVEAIDGKTEAGLIYLGAEKALSLKDKNALCIDIGGGSTEFINVNKKRTVFAESVKIGAVRLSKHFFPDFLINDKRISQCDHYIESLLKNSLGRYFSRKYDMIVGTSGTIESLAAMIIKQKKEKIPKSLNSVKFTNSELEAISTRILAAKKVKERLLIPGMEEKRADIIPAGLIILKNVFDLFKIKEMTISSYALREGIILDMMKKYQSSPDSF